LPQVVNGEGRHEHGPADGGGTAATRFMPPDENAKN
jgi:hypothetical protein